MTDLDPETALLGIVLARPKLMVDLEDVAPNDFATPRNEALWSLMLWLSSKRMPPDPVTVSQHLGRITIPGVDGLWIADLVHLAPIGSDGRHYAHLVIEAATLRRLTVAGNRIVQLAQGGGDSQEIAEMARQEVDASSRSIATAELIGDNIDATIEALEADTPTSIPTPWNDLNHLIQGWRPGGLYIIGARPGIGKTLMGLQAAVGLTEHGIVPFHSLEMPREEVNKRVIAQLATVATTRMDRHELSERDWSQIAKARERLGSMRLSVDDRSAIRVVDIRSYARTLRRRGPVAGIVVDYLQLMVASRGDRRPRHEQVADWSRSLKILAKDLHVPVIALSQLNRASEQRTDKKPTMADLRESGSLEQDADVILLLHVEEENPVDMTVLVAKNRQGAPGIFKLERRGDIARLDPPQWRPSAMATS